MKVPFKNLERIAGVILFGLFIGTLFIASIWYFQHTRQKSKMIPIEQALYVSDWEIKKIYGPGTTQQAKVVMQLKSVSESKIEFSTPALYRMNSTSSSKSDEGILLIPFDPSHPEKALLLSAETRPN